MTTENTSYYWKLLTNENNMKEVFRMLMKCQEFYNQGFKTKKEVANKYNDYYPKLNSESCMKYLNNLTKLNLIKEDKTDFILSYDGEMALRHFNIYKQTSSISDLRKFENIMINNLCSNYEVEMKNNMVQPFNYIMTFLRGMNGEMYLPELLLLFTTSNMSELEETMKFCKKFRNGIDNELMFMNYFARIKERNNLQDEDIDRIIIKYLGIPAICLKSLDLIEVTKSERNRAFITPKRQISFSERITLI